MRLSRVLLAGAAVAAAGIATSAFTAANTVPDSVAGFGQGQVSGAVINNIHYNANEADGTIVDSIDFVSETNITGKIVTMTLKEGATKTEVGTPVGEPFPCTVKVAWVGDGDPEVGAMTVNCATPSDGDGPVQFDDFDAVGLTVVQ